MINIRSLLRRDLSSCGWRSLIPPGVGMTGVRIGVWMMRSFFFSKWKLNSVRKFHFFLKSSSACHTTNEGWQAFVSVHEWCDHLFLAIGSACPLDLFWVILNSQYYYYYFSFLVLFSLWIHIFVWKMTNHSRGKFFTLSRFLGLWDDKIPCCFSPLCPYSN